MAGEGKWGKEIDRDGTIFVMSTPIEAINEAARQYFTPHKYEGGPGHRDPNGGRRPKGTAPLTDAYVKALFAPKEAGVGGPAGQGGSEDTSGV